MRPYRILFLFLLPFYVSAQSNYQKGFYISSKGDTVQGYVNLKDWLRNPISISFKPELTSEPKLLSVSDISYFSVDNIHNYQRFTVRVSMNRIDVDVSNKAPQSDTTAKTEMVFLRILQSGKYLTLYDYQDELKTRFYIKSDAMQIPAELIYLQYANPDGTTSLVTKNVFRNQLYKLAFDFQRADEKLKERIEIANYNGPDLSKIVSVVNDGVPVNRYRGGQKYSSANSQKISFFAGAGINAGTLKYGGNPFPGSSSSTMGLRLDAGLDISVSPHTHRTLFRTELAFSSETYLSTYSHASGIYGTNSQQLTHMNLAVIPQLVYHFYYSKAVKAFIAGGIGLNFSAYPTNKYNSTFQGDVSNRDNYPQMQKFFFSIPLKAGFTLVDRFEFFAGYTPPVLLSIDAVSCKLSSFQIGLNFLFGSGRRGA